jgi:hypothetical protein
MAATALALAPDAGVAPPDTDPTELGATLSSSARAAQACLVMPDLASATVRLSTKDRYRVDE